MRKVEVNAGKTLDENYVPNVPIITLQHNKFIVKPHLEYYITNFILYNTYRIHYVDRLNENTVKIV